MIVDQQIPNAWMTALQWDGTRWSFAWGRFDDIECARRSMVNRTEAQRARAALVQRLLKQHDKVFCLGADASVSVYRRVDALGGISVETFASLSEAPIQPAQPAAASNFLSFGSAITAAE